MDPDHDHQQLLTLTERRLEGVVPPVSPATAQEVVQPTKRRTGIETSLPKPPTYKKTQKAEKHVK